MTTLHVTNSPDAVAIPRYLEEIYWWAYVHPSAVRFFERQWLVNAILWGNFNRLRDAALDALGAPIPGRTLQVACVYGDLTVRLAQRIADPGALDVADVLPVQLNNLRTKLPAGALVNLLQRNSTALGVADASYDQVLVFFLLHEQPEQVRRGTLAEALRVVKPGGRVVIVDYHRPAMTNPIGHVLRPILRHLEPYALDLWRHEISTWLPQDRPPIRICKKTYFGGLYQRLILIP